MSINNLSQLTLLNLTSNVANGSTNNTSNNASNNFNSVLSSLSEDNATTNNLYSLLNESYNDNSIYSLFGNNNNSNNSLFGSGIDLAMYSLLNATARASKYNNTYKNNTNCNCSCSHKDSSDTNDKIQSSTTTSNTTQTTITNSTTSSSDLNTSLADKAVSMAKSFIGTPYIWGANGPSSFDCSGFTKYIYKQVYGKNIPRVSYNQAKFGTKVEKEDLQPGDLVFFDTMNKNRVSHVGIYIGNGKFIHAANSKKGVIESDLNSSYYTKTYKGARRP